LKPNELTKLKSPLSVNLEVTDKCNLGCSFCFNAAPEYVQLIKIGEQPFIDESGSSRMQQDRRDRLMRIVDKLAEAEVFEIRLFGGEFTVFKHWREILAYIAQKDFFISFVSNGYLFTEHDIDLLVHCGVRECSISIHGSEDVHDRITNKSGSFRRAMNSVAMLQRRNVTVSIAYTPIAENLHHVYEFVKQLREEYEVKHFGINRLFQDERYRNLVLADYHSLLEVIERCHHELGANIYLQDSFPRCMVPMKHWRYLSYCSQGVGFAQVDFNGNIKHCSAVSVPLGNVLQDDVSTLWDQKLVGMRKLDHLPRSCRICPIFCGGGCTASRGVKNKFAPDEFIPWPGEETWAEAFEKALYNRGRRLIYDLFVKEVETAKVHRSIERPVVSQRYKTRQEDPETFLAMFESKGIKILTPLAMAILEQMDGSKSIDEMVNICNQDGHHCNYDEVVEIVGDLV
jgi:radical SAM protein with 4Fe4S-binding SPASM domain